MIALIANLLGGTLTEWVKTKAVTSRIKAEARAKAVSDGIPGWNDEYLVLVWSWPVVAAYIPVDAVQQSAQKGIEIFNSYPDWYVTGFIAITSAVFGLDKAIKWRRS